VFLNDEDGGHGCLGCSEPSFWDAGSFYSPLSAPIGHVAKNVGYALAAGALAGAAIGVANKQKKLQAIEKHEKITVNDLTKGETE